MLIIVKYVNSCVKKELSDNTFIKILRLFYILSVFLYNTFYLCSIIMPHIKINKISRNLQSNLKPIIDMKK